MIIDTEDGLNNLYTTSEETSLKLRGNISGDSFEQIAVSFIPCFQTGKFNCAPKEEVQEYLDKNIFILGAFQNFIDLLNVRSKS